MHWLCWTKPVAISVSLGGETCAGPSMKARTPILSLRVFSPCAGCIVTWGRMRATMAVDAPLGFPDAFVQLITKFTPQAQIDGESNQNSYLFRLNERRLASEGLVMPLSAIKDMIGSQSTKAMHVIAKFKLQGVAVGIWSDERLTMIETYPSLCRKRLKRQKPEHLSAKNSDICDSSLCSRIAHDFHFKRKCLESPPLDAPTVEGWIWAPLAT